MSTYVEGFRRRLIRIIEDCPAEALRRETAQPSPLVVAQARSVARLLSTWEPLVGSEWTIEPTRGGIYLQFILADPALPEAWLLGTTVHPDGCVTMALMDEDQLVRLKEFEHR